MINSVLLEAKQNSLLTLSNGDIMSLGELARWELLFEALNLIEEEASEREEILDETKIASSIPMHKAINKYISERYWAQLADMCS